MSRAKHNRDRRDAPENAPVDVLDAERCWIVSSPEGAMLHVGARAVRMPLAKAQVCLEHLRHRGCIMLDFSQRFQLTRVLGAGAQGSVYEALELATGTAFAVKVAKGAEKMAALWQESRFLYELRRVDGVVGIKGVYEFRADGRRCLAVVLERLNSSLVPLLALPMGEDACRLVMRQLLTTVKAIHGQGVFGVTHGDIKPANVRGARGPVGWLHAVSLSTQSGRQETGLAVL
jgi:hypothetical protein